MESVVGQGSTFKFTFQLDEKMEEEVRVKRCLNPFSNKKDPMSINKAVKSESEQEMELQLLNMNHEDMQLDKS